MKRWIILLPLIAFVVFAMVDAHSADADAKSGFSHEGSWRPIAAILGGTKVPKPALDAITLKITGTNYEVKVVGEKEPDLGTFKIDSSTSPKRMTITSTNGPNRGKTFLAIYEMKDSGSMRVCYDLSGTEFPKEFKAPRGTSFYLVGYRRPKETP